jgi:acetate kinase
MNAYRIRKYIGSYAAAVNGLSRFFTAGMGENSYIRKLVCTDGLFWNRNRHGKRMIFVQKRIRKSIL